MMSAEYEQFHMNYINNIQENIEDIKILIDVHNTNSKNAQYLYNCLSYTETFLTASLSLSMTLLTVLKTEDYVVTIVGSTFAFLITLASKYKEFKKLNELAIKHSVASDNYYRIKQKMHMLLTQEQNNEKWSIILEDLLETKRNFHLEFVECNSCCL